MRILVLSDTHGKLGNAFDIWERLRNIDLVIHCGDHKHDGDELGDAWRIPCVSVNGNCDSYTKDEAIVKTPAGDILVCHGHGFYSEEELVEQAELHACIAVCFGHTHIPLISYTNGVYLINPGSISLPRGDHRASAAVITATEDDFYANIIYHDTIAGAKSRAENSVKGGYLRSLINYSDGF